MVRTKWSRLETRKEGSVLITIQAWHQQLWFPNKFLTYMHHDWGTTNGFLIINIALNNEARHSYARITYLVIYTTTTKVYILVYQLCIARSYTYVHVHIPLYAWYTFITFSPSPSGVGSQMGSFLGVRPNLYLRHRPTWVLERVLWAQTWVPSFLFLHLRCIRAWFHHFKLNGLTRVKNVPLQGRVVIKMIIIDWTNSLIKTHTIFLDMI